MQIMERYEPDDKLKRIGKQAGELLNAVHWNCRVQPATYILRLNEISDNVPPSGGES